MRLTPYIFHSNWSSSSFWEDELQFGASKALYQILVPKFGANCCTRLQIQHVWAWVWSAKLKFILSESGWTSIRMKTGWVRSIIAPRREAPRRLLVSNPGSQKDLFPSLRQQDSGNNPIGISTGYTVINSRVYFEVRFPVFQKIMKIIEFCVKGVIEICSVLDHFWRTFLVFLKRQARM